MTKNVKVNLKDKIVKKIIDLIGPYIDEVQNNINDLKDHVDELEDEFRHEVHVIQDNVPDTYELDTLISDQVGYKLSEEIGEYIDHYFSNLGIDLEEASGVSDKVDELVSELQEIGENLSRVG